MQTDFFANELQEVNSKFQGHYMTKLNKQLKAERDDLVKERQELVWTLFDQGYI